MTDVKDTVVSHITTNWTGTVVGGSGVAPTIDAVGPEDIVKPEDYPEAILVYNERAVWDRVYGQRAYGDRHTRIYILVTTHTKSGCTKTHFRAFIDELKSVFGSAVSGYDNQLLDEPENVTRTKGVQGGMYQASFVLHLWEYGIPTSSAAAGGAAGTTIWDEPFITSGSSANLTNETVLSAALGAHAHDIIPATDSTYDLGSATKYYAKIYVDDLYISNSVTGLDDADIPDDATLTNITQITTRSHTSLTDIGTNTHAQIDTHIADTSDPHGSTLTQSVAIDVPLIQNSAAIALKPSGDTDDYLSFDTQGDYPRISAIGGGGVINFESDSSGWFFLIFGEYVAGAGKYGYFGYNQADNICRLYNASGTGKIAIMPGGDSDDYLFFETASNIAYLKPCEDKVHCLGDPDESFDHVYSDDFDNTSPFEVINQPLDALKAISHKTVEEKDMLDYTTLPDFVRTHTRDPKKDVIEEYVDELGNTQQRVIERAPKDVIAEEGFSINRMCILLYQAVQELTEKVEALEAAQAVPKGG